MNNIVFKTFSAFLLDRSIPKDITIFSLILLLIPIALISGPAIPDICLSLIALYFLLKSIFFKYWSYYRNPIVFGFLLFSLYGIIRSIFSEIPIDSLTHEGSAFYFRYIFFSMGVWYLLDKNRYLSKCFLFIIIACLIAVGLDGIYQYVNGVNIFGFEKFSSNRLTGLFRDEPIIGRYISYFSILAVALIYQNFKYSKFLAFYTIFILIFSLVITFLSGERSPLFYLIFFMFIIFIYLPINSKLKILGLFIPILLLFVFTQINPNAKLRIIDMTIQQVSETKFPFLPYSSHHEAHYISAIKMFNDKPFFGVGTNTFYKMCEKKEYEYNRLSCSSHPHNFYIQALAELGIFGFLLILSFFGYISFHLIKNTLQNFFKKNKHSSYDLTLFISILFIFWWPVIPHMSLYNNWNNVIIMLPLGFFMRYIYKVKINGNYI